MKIDAISDLHGHFPTLEGGDLLIVAGDLTARHTLKETEDFWRWACYQPYKKVVVIAGNHDEAIRNNPHVLRNCGEEVCYLQDSGIEFEGIKIWGSPWTKKFPNISPRCQAFTLDTEAELDEKWKLIPNDTDILITHSPPLGALLDLTTRGEFVGSPSLWNVVQNIKPKIHVFGHVHEGFGDTYFKPTRFVNASQVNEYYQPVNKPVRVFLEDFV